jgi:DNA-binding response OmpR family regulator
MPTSAAPGDQPHLLVVDDAAERGACIADVAERVGYRCTLATDTAHFTAALRPDVALIMLDLLLPETDGIALLRLAGAAGARRGCQTIHGGQRRW